MRATSVPADARERHRLRRPPADRVDQIELRDAVVVVGARLDRDFLERRDPLVAGRPEDPHVGGRSSITRMKYSTSPIEPSPSASDSRTR